MSRLQIALPNQLPFITRLCVRINDINYGAHLGNDALISLLHEARLRLLRAHGLSERDCGGPGIVVSELEVVYRAEGFYGDELEVALAVGAINRSSASIFYRVCRPADGREIARARTGIVFFDYTVRRPTRTPTAFLEAFRDAPNRPPGETEPPPSVSAGIP